jgi:hypothetical protein
MVGTALRAFPPYQLNTVILTKVTRTRDDFPVGGLHWRENGMIALGRLQCLDCS